MMQVDHWLRRLRACWREAIIASALLTGVVAPSAAQSLYLTLHSWIDGKIVTHLDRDGYPDLLVKSFDSTIRLHSGRDFALLLEIPGPGVTVAAFDTMPDINGDRTPDIIAGMPGLGQVRVYSGADGKELRRILA